MTPKPSLWIAADLGDVGMLRQFLGGRGRLTASGRRNRSHLIAMGVVFGAMPMRQDADDLEIMWEAFRIAGWNHRWHTMDALLIDHAPLGTPLIAEAALNMHLGTVPLAEFLVSRGADIDRDWGPRVGGSVRDALPLLVEGLADAGDPQVQRMLDICGAGTVAGILAARDTQAKAAVTLLRVTERALLLAADDVAALGATAVNTEHLLVGWLRVHGGELGDIFVGRGVNMGDLQTRLVARLRADVYPLGGRNLPLDAQATASVKTVRERAESQRCDGVSPYHLLIGILQVDEGPGAQMLRAVGVTASTFGHNYVHLSQGANTNVRLGVGQTS